MVSFLLGLVDHKYSFEVGVSLLVLLIMLMSSRPKNGAILVCVLVAFFGLFLNLIYEYGYISSFFIFPLAAIFGGFAGFSLIYLARYLPGPMDRRYFYIMAGFLFASGAVNSALMTLYNHSELFSFPVYTFFFHSVAVSHILAMLILSDGTRTIIRNLRDFGYTLRHGISSSRS